MVNLVYPGIITQKAMEYNIDTIREDNYLRIIATGEIDRPEDFLKIYAGTLAQALEKGEGANKYIIDFRRLYYPAELSDALEYAKGLDSEGFEIVKSFSVAILVRHEVLKNSLFYETYMSNRGYNFKIFTAIEDADKWLFESA